LFGFVQKKSGNPQQRGVLNAIERKREKNWGEIKKKKKLLMRGTRDGGTGIGKEKRRFS